jgi:hypothetical protein
VTDGTHSVSIELLGNYLATTFDIGPESGGPGTLVTDPPAGTRLRALVHVGRRLIRRGDGLVIAGIRNASHKLTGPSDYRVDLRF